MSAAGPVLRDIHVAPAPWWPPAPGWWLLALLVVAAAVIAAWWWRARRRSRQAGAALREIDRLAARFAADGDRAALAAGASRLLRRVARQVEPGVVASHGESWREFVRRHVHDGAEAALLDSLRDAAFRPHPALDPDALLAALRVWCPRALQARRRRTRNPSPFADRGGTSAPPATTGSAMTSGQGTQEPAPP